MKRFADWLCGVASTKTWLYAVVGALVVGAFAGTVMAAAGMYLSANEVIRFAWHPITTGSRTQQVSVGTSAVQMRAQGLASRRAFCVRAAAARDVFYGYTSTVTTSIGHRIPAGSERCFTLDAVSPDLYFIAGSSGTDTWEHIR